jgi:S1-C subfamily serine protease
MARKSNTVRLGEDVFTLGFPLGKLLEKSAKFSDSTVSSLSGLLGSANLFQINNPIQLGNSGGPLFDRDGNLIGVMVPMLDVKFFYGNSLTIPQNVNFAIKSDYLINLISLLPEGSSILSLKGALQDKMREEQVKSLLPYIVTVYVR